MNNRTSFKSPVFSRFKTLMAIFCQILLLVSLGKAQTAQFTAPREQKLLNGLKILVWNQPSAPKLTMKLRVHSGAAFDPKDKMGVMALLGDIIFPSEQSRAFFTEDLEGSVEVNTTYDYIQITATGNANEALSMIETFASAVVNTPINQENFQIVQQSRLQKVQELEKSPAYLADLAVAKRLFGEFPYGRSAAGTSESLGKITYADLLFARERFLTSDNATLVFIGNIQPEFAYKASRQLFGAWTKADRKIPPTFRQPETPNTAVERINLETADSLEIRRAWRAIARNDKDFQAARVLTKIWQNRLEKSSQIDFNPHVLPGYFNLKISSAPMNSTEMTDGALPLPMSAANLTGKAPEQAEFDRAKADILGEIGKNHISDLWLDVDTYKLNSVQKDIENLQNVTITDVRNIAEKLKNEAVVTVVLTGAKATAAKDSGH